jgi:uracil-DNA glycosylase
MTEVTAAAEQLLQTPPIHPDWRPLLSAALSTMNPDYLQTLLDDDDWLPGKDRLFAAFGTKPQSCRYILFGESPYPRKASANGIAFHDAAVGELWSPSGLSKTVNRATSLRNIVKTALCAEGLVEPDAQGRVSQTQIARLDKQGLVQTLDQLFERLHAAGCLMLNATPVLHPKRKAHAESRQWKPFTERLLTQIGKTLENPPTLVLWGRIAAEIGSLAATAAFPRISSEHPYNVSFIQNKDMLDLFGRLGLLELRQQA